MNLSIIIPVYNGRKYIIECLQSVVNQSVADLELIVVDDASDDGTEDLVMGFLRQHPGLRYTYIRLDVNVGASQARRKGVATAAGEYIGFVDSDDWIEEDYYEKLLNCAEETGADIVCAEVIKEKRRTGKRKKTAGMRRQADLPFLLRSDEAILKMLNREAVYQYAVNKIFRREILNDMESRGAFAEGSFIGEDFDMVYKALSMATSIAITCHAVYHYRVHNASLTQQGFTAERRMAYEKYSAFYTAFSGGTEYKNALARYLMLEYMSFLLAMYRKGVRDLIIEQEILTFIKTNRRDYIRYTKDGFAAKCYAIIAGSFLNRFVVLFYSGMQRS